MEIPHAYELSCQSIYEDVQTKCLQFKQTRKQTPWPHLINSLLHFEKSLVSKVLARSLESSQTWAVNVGDVVQ